MRLILQCAVCGTVNAIGLRECGTCRATGLEHLRLLFECPRCIRLDLCPTCEPCSRLLSLDEPYEIVPEPIDPTNLARLWGVEEEAASPSAGEADGLLEPAWEDEPIESEVALTLDETAELATLDVEELSLEDDEESKPRPY